MYMYVYIHIHIILIDTLNELQGVQDVANESYTLLSAVERGALRQEIANP